MHIDHAVSLVRRDIGDQATQFLTTAVADGMTMIYDLPPINVNPAGLLIQMIAGTATTVIQPASAYQPWSSTTAYSTNATVSYSGYYYHCLVGNTGTAPSSSGVSTTDWAADIVYTLDSPAGVLTMSSPIANGVTLVVAGQSWGMFTDEDITEILHDASRQHCQGQTLTERYRNTIGFITYRDVPKTIHNLPKNEESLVTCLAEIDLFWILASDAATEVNVNTAEGTDINRTARYQQLMTHIQALTEWYERKCGEWNVGMMRWETLNLRRVSRTNGRLVPLFRDREYDDHRYPVRELPQVDRRDEDNSGVPSPIWTGQPL